MTVARVRLATPDDAPTIAGIHIRAWRAAYRGVVPDAILDGLSLEPRTAWWRASIERQAGESHAVSAAPPDRTWVAETDDGILGFASSGAGRDESAPPPAGSGEVYAIYLEPDAIGRGHGQALFAHAVSDLTSRGADPIVVWVFEANGVARRFYEAAGFHADGARSTIDFDGVPLDEIRYRLDG
jgi:ribosomal protein S18 acetylase RimI-like enzyme